MCKMTCLWIEKEHLECGTRIFFLRAHNLLLVARSSYLMPTLSINRHQYITTDCILNSPQRYETTERFTCCDLPLQLHVNCLNLKASSHVNKARVTGLEVLTSTSTFIECENSCGVRCEDYFMFFLSSVKWDLNKSCLKLQACVCKLLWHHS